MLIKWSVVKPAVMEMFKFYSHSKHDTWTGEVMTVYARYYRAVDRPADAESKRDVAEAAKDWDDFAESAAFRPQSAFDKKTLQVQGTDRSNRWIDRPENLKPDDSIVSIMHIARTAPVVSRFQVVVRPEFAGQEFYGMLVHWASSSSAVSQWKVMNPILGSSGPDSAVFYLNQPLSDGTVQALIIEISEKLAAILQELDSPPFGLQRLGVGIYGIDVPTNNVQRNQLSMTRDVGSAGQIISSIVCKAAMFAANDLYFHPKMAEHQQKATLLGGPENYAKEVLRNVLRMDLGWELIN